MISIIKLNSPTAVEKNLLCFHWVGGNSYGYRPLAKQIEKDNIAVYGINLPGRNGTLNSNQIIENISDIVLQLINALKSKNDELKVDVIPTVLFGHSFGGLVVFELYRKISALKLNNIRIVKLILSAVKNPLDLTAFNADPNSKFHHTDTDDELSNYIKSIGGKNCFLITLTFYLHNCLSKQKK